LCTPCVLALHNFCATLQMGNTSSSNSTDGPACDAALISVKAELKALLKAVSTLIATYEPWIQGTSGPIDSLNFPSLAIWTTETPFLGGEAAAKPIHDLAALVEELSLATLRARTVVYQRFVEDLEVIMTRLHAGAHTLDAYLVAEAKLSEKRARFEAAAATANFVTEADKEEDEEEAKEEAEADADATQGKPLAPLLDLFVASKAADKLAKLKASMQVAAGTVQAAKAAALAVRDEVAAIKAGHLREAHERLREGLSEEAQRVAGLLGDPATEGRFDAYEPTAARGRPTGTAHPFQIKLENFGRDASDHAAQVVEAEKQLRSADALLELSQMQANALSFDGWERGAFFTPPGGGAAFDALIAAVAAEESTRAAIVAARVRGSEASVAAVGKAARALVNGIRGYRAGIASRLSEAKAYHELGKRHTSLTGTLRRAEAVLSKQCDHFGLGGKREAVVELRAEAEAVATRLVAAYEEFQAQMARMGDGADLVRTSIVVPLARFVKAVMQQWKAQHEAMLEEDVQWLYPPVPELHASAATEAPALSRS